MSHLLARSLQQDLVGSLALRPVCAVSPRTPVAEAVGQMQSCKTGCCLVVEGDRLVGIFTERDFLNRVLATSGDPQAPVGGVMTADPQSVGADASIQSAIGIIERAGYRHLPVLPAEGTLPVGVLSIKDIMHYLVEHFPERVYNLPPTTQTHQPAREGA